ncbi:hypothetical protein [Blastococcus sp. Marseille-P5729]|uniref:hypothetical protein n=1 Tax=Blastococcus sp. Marseille-P5729 TaxID=2086582 RepID=UPI000D0EBD42|nr:hypothetical protein [Blastococcus sp. Marseille-P5729]
MFLTVVRRAAVGVAASALGVSAVAGCVTTVQGTAGYAPGTVTSSSSSSGSASADPQEELKKQCAVALTTAKGFLDSWKELASSGITPTAEQREGLANEVQGYIDQLNAQLPTIVDATLISHVQAIVAEMAKIVEGLKSGIAVELTAYRTAVNNATDYCG